MAAALMKRESEEQEESQEPMRAGFEEEAVPSVEEGINHLNF